MRTQSLMISAALAAWALSCAAQETPSSGAYVAPIVTGIRTDDDRAVDDEAAFALATGFEASPEWSLELNLFRGRFDGAGGNDLELDAAGINALRVFRRATRVAPFLLVGVGAQRNDRENGDSSTNAYGDAGAGLLAALRRSQSDGRGLFLRLDARARYDDADGGSRLDYLLGLGLQYAFGSGRPQRAPPPAAAQPQPQPPADEDRDGVPDRDDRCLGTPPGRTVGTDGCEPDVDADDDGVANDVDACPGTPGGTRIDARGCELKKEIRLPRVTFEYGSDRLRPEAFATLDEAVETLRLNPDLRLEVAGHTDDRGSDSYNQVLSQRRAEAVRRYLVDKGVTNVLTVRGYGEIDPIADNGTEAGRAENRRVVLRIL